MEVNWCILTTGDAVLNRSALPRFSCRYPMYHMYVINAYICTFVWRCTYKVICMYV